MDTKKMLVVWIVAMFCFSLLRFVESKVAKEEVNCLSGEIPKYLGKFTSLTYLNLEANQFSGPVPPALGDLVKLETLMLSSNQLTRNLPVTFSLLRNLTDLRISDINGPSQDFPVLRNMKRLLTLVLRNLM
ncbi:hypothetical protein F3Y22_tig00002237pilonHSYRG00356 [Hibiscus syriacus]|uniref:Uncharacterized protein n=1 Tax=Hibiscus syriacus TaxID=106335 RepID=A0A6A3CRE9_HIBSY|nr:hypothetical protein F3Y22_tig00002237pilonHSYRG00356 [Hibiscus syriacus]